MRKFAVAPQTDPANVESASGAPTSWYSVARIAKSSAVVPSDVSVLRAKRA